VWIWLNSPNSNLGGERPIELLANGKQERVVWAIELIGDAVFPAPGARGQAENETEGGADVTESHQAKGVTIVPDGTTDEEMDIYRTGGEIPIRASDAANGPADFDG
jgi:hypothetical protein